jgi:two-component system chemotaxis sensor kinase CheA
MTHDQDTSGILDAAAEAIIMVDPGDPGSIADLVERVNAMRAIFAGVVQNSHPFYALLQAATRLESGQAEALSDLQTHFATCKAAASKAASRGDASAADPATPPAEPTPVAPAPGVMPLACDDELLRDFAIRSAEHLDDADERLLALEADPTDADAIDAIFRAFHTIKGMAGFLALDEVSTFAHASESLLEDARHGGGAVPEKSVQALFSAVDGMRRLVAIATGTELASGQASGGAEDGAERPRPAGSVHAPGADVASARAGTVRVDEGRLDALLDAIGEMVIAQSMVSASTRGAADAATLGLQVERLDKITRELQQMATSLRMVPLRATFRRMARLVRDVANKAGKEVEFVVVGEDTELDKVVVDRISDPLVHALRNAVDHGIELPAERVAAGKPAAGRVELRASHAGGAIQVRVTDDGRGIETAEVLRRARDFGLVEESDTPDDRAILDLVYAPGFSTSETVTDVSGRGVGMDVVKRTVEELRGRVELRSTPGEGTSVEIRLPLTLAIIDGMILRVGSERYVMPLLAIERTVRPTSEQISTVAGRGQMLALPEGLVPVLRLHELFSTPGAETDLTRAVVVIVNDNGARAGLLACELLGQQQTVIKPLGEGLPEQPGIAGGAIMPDGRVGLILDAAGLIKTAQQPGGE